MITFVSDFETLRVRHTNYGFYVKDYLDYPDWTEIEGN